jgi:hypothetical protein
MVAQQLKLVFDQTTELTKALRTTASAIRAAVTSLSEAETAPLAEIQKRVTALERAATPAPVRTALPSLESAVSNARSRVNEIEARRRDVIARREAVAKAASEQQRPFRHSDRWDWLGPFRLDHTETETTVRLGKTAVARLKTPTALEVLDGVHKAETQIKAEALKGFADFASALYQEQQRETAAEPVLIRELFARVVSDAKARAKQEPVFVYRLSLLLSGAAPGGWLLRCLPPTLAEQRQAIEVPDVLRPGESTRVSRGRLEPPADASSRPKP